MTNRDLLSSQFKFNPPELKNREKWDDAVSLLPGISLTSYMCKCLYFIGTIRHVINGASNLYLLEGKYEYNLPALLLTCSAIEFLGRCIRGDDKDYAAGHSKKNLKAGYKKIVQTSFPHKNDHHISVDSPSGNSYSKDELLALRNFSAHGFYGTLNPELTIDRIFIGWLIGSTGDALNSYYQELKITEEVAKKMAKAKMNPLYYDDPELGIRPIHIEKIYKMLSDGKMPGDFDFQEKWGREYLEIKALNQSH